MINDITQLLTFLPYYNTTLVVNTFSVTIAIRADGPTNVDHGQSFNDCLMIMVWPAIAAGGELKNVMNFKVSVYTDMSVTLQSMIFHRLYIQQV